MKLETYERVMSAPDPRDRMGLGCNDCDTYVTPRQLDADPGIAFDWSDIGDDGVLCPACSAEAASEEEDE